MAISKTSHTKKDQVQAPESAALPKVLSIRASDDLCARLDKAANKASRNRTGQVLFYIKNGLKAEGM